MTINRQVTHAGNERRADDELNVVYPDLLRPDDAGLLRVFVFVTAHGGVIHGEAPRAFPFGLFESDLERIGSRGIALRFEPARNQGGLHHRDDSVLVAQGEEEKLPVFLLAPQGKAKYQSEPEAKAPTRNPTRRGHGKTGGRSP